MIDTTTKSWADLYESSRQALQLKQLGEAERLLLVALRIAEEDEGDRTRLALTLNALARVYSLQQQYRAATALLHRLAGIKEESLGRSHQQVASVLSNLAEMYAQLGEDADELAIRERVLEIRSIGSDIDEAALYKLRIRVDQLRHAIAERTRRETGRSLLPPFLASVADIDVLEPAAPATPPTPSLMAEVAARIEADVAASFEPASAADAATAPPAAAPRTPYSTPTIREIPAPDSFEIHDVPQIPAPADRAVLADVAAPVEARRRLPVSPRALVGLAAGIALAVWLIASQGGSRTTASQAPVAQTSSPGAVQSAPAAVVTVATPTAVSSDGAAGRAAPSDEVTSGGERAPTAAARRDSGRPGGRGTDGLVIPTIATERLAQAADAALQRIDSSTRVLDSARRIDVQAPEFKSVRVSELRPPRTPTPRPLPPRP